VITRPDFPEVIDNSMRSDFVSCPRKCELKNILHWKPKDQSIHLHAGAAYAHGLEVARRAFYGDGRPEKEAIGRGLAALMDAYGDFQCPPESAKSCERMLGALEFYFYSFPMGNDYAKPHDFGGDVLGVEFSFAHPIDVLHPVTGQPLLYAGRLDAVMDFAGGVYPLDDKTTSGIGPKWSQQWDLRAQFSGYTWGVRAAGISTDGFIVRGLGILKTKFDSAEAVTYRPPWMVERWYQQLLRDIQRMIKCWKEGYWDYNLDDACNAYGGCEFKRICLAENTEQWLETGYERRRWDPVTRTETKLEVGQ
jgi:hypothetical protein